MPDAHDIDAGSFGPVAPVYDTLMAGVPYGLWLDYIRRVWTSQGLAPRRILDLACGTGTMSRLLAKNGYDVTGVDLSGPMLETARQRAAEEGLSIPFLRQDAAELALEGAFDACICLFDSLNYILDPARMAVACAHVSRHLAPGGSFLFDLNTEHALAEGMFNQSCTRRDAPLHYRWRSRYDRDTRICTVRMNFSYAAGGAGGERESFIEVHRQRAYTKDEILEYLRDAGFAETFVYDAYSLSPPKKRSDRLFYLGIKSDT